MVGLLAVEVALIVGMTGLLQSRIKAAVWRRTIWQVGMASILVLSLVELSGVAREAAARLNARVGPASRQSSPKPAALPDIDHDFKAADPALPPMHSVSLQTPADVRLPSPIPGAATPIPSASLTIRWLGLVWVVGCAILLARIVVARCAFLIFFRKRQSIMGGELEQRVRLLAASIGIRRRVRLIEASSLSGPIAFGILRPAIGLPRQFTGSFAIAQQEVMLAHELAHLAARDPLWYLLAEAAVALLWWHPLVWWARRQLHVASETAADEASTLIANGPGILAECLVTLGARMEQRRVFGWLGIEGFRSGLGRRVERLFTLKGNLWRPLNPVRSSLAKTFGPVALAAGVVLCTAWAAPRALTKGEEMKTWKRSLAAVALMAMLGNDKAGLAAENPPNLSFKPAKSPAIAEPVAVAPKPVLDSHGNPATIQESKRTAAMRSKLEQIILPQVSYDGLPLGEVVKQLIDESAKRDPDKLGLNFLFSASLPPATAPAQDPATGLPIPVAVEPVDLQSTTVRIIPPLKNVRLLDVLDAITKVADRPIKYTIEEYAVVFFLDGYAISSPPLAPAARPIDPASLQVQTFHVGTNNFFAGVEKTFGVRIGTESASRIQTDLRQFLVRLGVNMDTPHKSIFFNQATGVLMVRATAEDLQLVNAALETLAVRQEATGKVSTPDNR